MKPPQPPSQLVYSKVATVTDDPSAAPGYIFGVSHFFAYNGYLFGVSLAYIINAAFSNL